MTLSLNLSIFVINCKKLIHHEKRYAMTNKFLFSSLFLFLFAFSIHAQIDINKDRAENLRNDEEKDNDGWSGGMGLGLDFFQLLQINPKVGAGEDRIQFGGLSTGFINYKKGLLDWENTGTLLLGAQRLGSGTTAIGGNVLSKPYQKTIDELRLLSLLTYRMSEESNWSYSTNLIVFTQLLPTYRGNFLKDVTESGEGPISKFFSPAQLNFSPGIRYEPTENFSVSYSPASLKGIIVGSEEIAAIPGDEEAMVGLHGTEWRGPDDFDQLLLQFGSSIRAEYKNKYLNDKLLTRSELILFSNYLEEAKNVDLDWRNEIAYEIVKGLKLTVIVNLFYDHDILLQKSDRDQPDGIERDEMGNPILGRGLNVIQTVALQYNYVF
jgi:hypothetical protein